MRARARGSVVLAAILALVGVLAASPAPAAAAEDQLQDFAVKTYKLDPDRGTLVITQQYILTNKAPSTRRSYPCTTYVIDPYLGAIPVQTTCTTRTDYYYDRYTLWVEKDAKSIKVKPSSGKATFKFGKVDGDWRQLSINHSPLYYGKTLKFTLTYELPAGGPRSDTDRRVGWYYSSFCAAGPGSDTGQLRVIAPSGFTFTQRFGTLAKSPDGAMTNYDGERKSFADRDSVCFDGTNADDGFTNTVIPVPGDSDITVSSWREDATWRDAVQGAVTDDVPKLRGLLGDMDPGGYTIRETLSSGDRWNSLNRNNRIMDLSEDVVARSDVTVRLAATWFDTDLFDDRWLIEGHARWASLEAGAVAAADVPCTDPGPAGERGAVRLIAWQTLGDSPTEDALAAHAYQRQAACHVVASVADAIGAATLLDVTATMRAGTAAWSEPPAEPDSYDWKAWLDIVERRGFVPAGADPAILDGLMTRFGLTSPTDTAARRDAITAADAVAAELGGVLPPAIATALEDWAFEDAQARIAATTAVLATLDDVTARVPEASVTDGEVIRLLTAAATDDALEEAAALASDQAALATRAADAVALAAAPRDMIQELGLVGDVLPNASDAVAAVSSIDAAGVDTYEGRVRTLIGGARDAGTLRLAVAISVVLGLVLLVIGVLVLRRRRRRRSVTLATASGPAVTMAPTAGAGDGAAVEPAAAVTPAASVEPGTSAHAAIEPGGGEPGS